MTTYDKIVAEYPDLAVTSENIMNNVFFKGLVVLQNDSDGYGDYIKEWNIELPIPDGLKVGKE